MHDVEVTTGSRLHFGLICAKPSSRWHFGGVGLMVDAPTWRVQIKRAEEDHISAKNEIAERIQTVLSAFRSKEETLGTVSVVVRDDAPLHTGLGSGTQLSLALGAGLQVLAGHGRPRHSAELAASLGRSKRSAVGTCGFDRGGFVIDHGVSENDSPRKVECLRFPEDWRFVLVAPRAIEGLSGQPEEQFFGSTSYLEDSVADELGSLIVDGLQPAIQQGDFENFSKALFDYGTLAGQFYAEEQGGLYSSALIGRLVDELATEGIEGAVQSSWGPTICYAAADFAAAESIAAAVAQKDDANQLIVRIVTARNGGAAFSSSEPIQRSWG